MVMDQGSGFDLAAEVIAVDLRHIEGETATAEADAGVLDLGAGGACSYATEACFRFGLLGDRDGSVHINRADLRGTL